VDEAVGRIDWTGVGPDESPIEPLDSHTFVVRLRHLSERAESLTLLSGGHRKAGRPQDLLDIAQLQDIQRRLK